VKINGGNVNDDDYDYHNDKHKDDDGDSDLKTKQFIMDAEDAVYRSTLYCHACKSCGSFCESEKTSC